MQSSNVNQQTTNNIYDQKEFSADQLGDDISLSTYAWEWAPYINAFKRKLYTVWFTPPAYYRLGLIHGQTIIRFTITKDGNQAFGGYKTSDNAKFPPGECHWRLNRPTPAV